MDQIIHANKDKINFKNCYFFSIHTPQQGKLKIWNDKYYDYIQRKEYNSINDWMLGLNYTLIDIYWGSTKQPLDENIKLSDLILRFNPIYEFEDSEEEIEEEEVVEEDFVMNEMVQNTNLWCFCCKRTCPKCSSKME
jgi:hypothetical protein